MFSRYYQSELTYLRELGKEFASVNPSLAGLFAERGGDPDVERLLEGFAFLTSRIRERIDDAVPEVIDAVTQLIVPQMSRPIPACSVVEFKPNFSALRGVHVVERHTELGSVPLEGTQCRFRTTAPLELLPLELVKTTLDSSREKAPRIHVHFRRRGGTVPWPEHGRLLLYLSGPTGLTSTIFLWLHQHLKGVSFLGSSNSELPLPEAKVRHLGLGEDLELLPWPEVAPDGLRLIQELFTLSSKLLFVELSGLERVPEDMVGGSFELVFDFEQPPALPERIDDDLFRLHCIPVINLFETSADPLTRDSRVHEHLVRAAGIDPLHMEVYSVDSVIGLGAQRQSRRTYAPFYSFAHLDAAADRGFYALRRTPSPIDNATDTYLAVMTPSDVTPTFEEEVLSMELTCTNRTLPTELRLGDISKPTPRSPTVAKFSNITEVTRPARPPIGAEMHWRLVSHLSLNVHTLTNAESLKALLHHYNLHRESDHQRSRTNEHRINALRTVVSKPELRIMDRVPVRGFHTHVEVDESGYTAVGDAFLFGCALNWLFATETPLNSYHRLTMSVHPLGVEFEWPPTTGTQPIF